MSSESLDNNQLLIFTGLGPWEMNKSISAERLHFAAVEASLLRTESNFALGIENYQEGIKVH